MHFSIMHLLLVLHAVDLLFSCSGTLHLPFRVDFVEQSALNSVGCFAAFRHFIFSFCMLFYFCSLVIHTILNSEQTIRPSRECFFFFWLTVNLHHCVCF